MPSFSSLEEMTLSDYMQGWPAGRVAGEPFFHYKIRRRATNVATKAYLRGTVIYPSHYGIPYVKPKEV
jgi:hypothetical protein